MHAVGEGSQSSLHHHMGSHLIIHLDQRPYDTGGRGEREERGVRGEGGEGSEGREGVREGVRGEGVEWGRRGE